LFDGIPILYALLFIININATKLSEIIAPPESIALKASVCSVCANAKFMCANEKETKDIATASVVTSIFGL
jgi:hypothetical protein